MSVLKIFVCPDKGMPMVEVESVKAIEGAGLEGDRYASGKGTFSKANRKAIRQVTLISIEAFNEANAKLKTPFTLEQTRRNIVVEGFDLNSRVNKQFWVGSVEMRGFELCDPCKRPALLANRPTDELDDFRIAFDSRGGLRAEILNTGVINVGHPISYWYPHPGWELKKEGRYYHAQWLIIGNYYKLTEFVEGKEVSSGNFLLISTKPRQKKQYAPILGFAKTSNQPEQVCLVEAHTQFGDPTWRRYFPNGNDGDIYWPAGGCTWNWSWVQIEDAEGL